MITVCLVIVILLLMMILCSEEVLVRAKLEIYRS